MGTEANSTLRPMAIGSDSGWLTLAGMMARRAATSARTNSGSRPSRAATKFISEVIWFVLDERLAADGQALVRGPILERSVLELRSYVTQPMHV